MIWSVREVACERSACLSERENFGVGREDIQVRVQSLRLWPCLAAWVQVGRGMTSGRRRLDLTTATTGHVTCVFHLAVQLQLCRRAYRGSRVVPSVRSWVDYSRISAPRAPRPLPRGQHPAADRIRVRNGSLPWCSTFH